MKLFDFIDELIFPPEGPDSPEAQVGAVIGVLFIFGSVALIVWLFA